MSSPLTIWTNARLPQLAAEELKRGVEPHRLLIAEKLAGNLVAGTPDAQLEQASIAFGQPDVNQVITLANLKWVHLSSAGYARYDWPEVRAALKRRGAILTNSSSVFAEPCAEHALAFMMSHARRIPDAVANKIASRAWPTPEFRGRSAILAGQTALILGLGAIGRRLIELLNPFRMNLIAIRQTVRGDESVETHSLADLDRLIPRADHVINILPTSPTTDRLFNTARFSRMKPGAVFYNLGRGTTVVQPDLLAALLGGHIQAAYLDVTDPEPLPPEHPLWLAPTCHITPHTAGGHAGEFSDSVKHFLKNLPLFQAGSPLLDRIM